MNTFKKRNTFKLTDNQPKYAGYYYAVAKDNNIPQMKEVLKSPDGCYVSDFIWVEDTTKPRVNGNIQGYVPKAISRPLCDFVLWSDRIPFPDGWPNLFLSE